MQELSPSIKQRNTHLCSILYDALFARDEKDVRLNTSLIGCSGRQITFLSKGLGVADRSVHEVT